MADVSNSSSSSDGMEKKIFLPRAGLRSLPAPLVIDDLRRLLQPGGLRHPTFAALRTLVDQGRAWMKPPGVYHDSVAGAPDDADMALVLKQWLATAPERMLCVTEWPHTAAMAGEKPMPTTHACWISSASRPPDASVRQCVLVANPTLFHGFDNDL